MPQPMVFAAGAGQFKPAPIRPEWILSGAPDAHNQVLVVSEDRALMTIFWRCAAGSFRWHYDEEETIYVLDGGMILTFPDGEVRKVGKGDVVYFAAGTSAVWEVESHVHKVAVFRRPAPKLLGAVVSLHHRAAAFLARLPAAAKPRPNPVPMPVAA